MVLGSDELQDLSEELYAEHRISSSLHCGNCGYNLRRLPYVYTCPECGNAYDANALKMTGIFLPGTGSFPWSDLLAAILCLLSAALLVATSFEAAPAPVGSSPRLALTQLRVFDPGRLVFGMLLAALAPIYLGRVFSQFKRFLKRLVIHRRILSEDS